MEREPLLSELDGLVAAAARRGFSVLVEGGAGEGKTSVLRALTERARVPVWMGACDALATPRPLGPIHDIAVASSEMASLVEEAGTRFELFDALLGRMARASRVLVVEDAHWADEATIDLLVFLGRRMHQTASTLLVSYRHDEVVGTHPLRRFLGDVATTPGHRRIRIEPLTVDGVGKLAEGHPLDPEALHRITGGNPFYVTEVLAEPGWTVPPTVVDAVLARASRLPPEERSVLEAVSAEPGPCERRLLVELGIEPAAIDGILRSGMLVSTGETVTFRHELARLAVLDSLTDLGRTSTHRRMLAILETWPAEPARLAHHAVGAGDDDAVARWAIRAGREASSSRAHREAAAQYRTAVEAADRMGETRPGDVDLTELLQEYAAELAHIHSRQEELAVRRRVLAAVKEPSDRAIALARLADASWTAGDGRASRHAMAEAVQMAERDVSLRAEALVRANAARLAMLMRNSERALEESALALTLAEREGFDDILVSALEARGSTRVGMLEDLGGIEDLERCAELAAALGDDRHHVIALSNAGSGAGETRRYSIAVPYLERAMAAAADRDIDSLHLYSQTWLGRVRFEQGRWDEAAQLVDPALDATGASPINAIVGLTTMARINTRRGSGEALDPLLQAWQLAESTGDLQRLWPVLAGRAELAWLTGRDDQQIREDLDTVLALAQPLGVRWAVGEVGFWAWRLGHIDSAPADSAEPYRLHIAGDTGSAAAAWAELGCPYEQAMALADGDDEASLRAALEIAVSLGARPLADRVRSRMRATGLANIPSGPRGPTTTHPGGLTPRQAEVLALLANGYSDREIAEALFISVKTAGHHVSAILRKLGVNSRTEAVVLAIAEGWLGPQV